jgi:hypothetical protein
VARRSNPERLWWLAGHGCSQLSVCVSAFRYFVGSTPLCAPAGGRSTGPWDIWARVPERSATRARQRPALVPIWRPPSGPRQISRKQSSGGRGTAQHQARSSGREPVSKWDGTILLVSQRSAAPSPHLPPRAGRRPLRGRLSGPHPCWRCWSSLAALGAACPTGPAHANPTLLLDGPMRSRVAWCQDAQHRPPPLTPRCQTPTFRPRERAGHPWARNKQSAAPLPADTPAAATGRSPHRTAPRLRTRLPQVRAAGHLDRSTGLRPHAAFRFVFLVPQHSLFVSCFPTCRRFASATTAHSHACMRAQVSELAHPQAQAQAQHHRGVAAADAHLIRRGPRLRGDSASSTFHRSST